MFYRICLVLSVCCGLVFASQTVVLQENFDDGDVVSDPCWVTLNGAFSVVRETINAGFDDTSNWYIDPSLHCDRLVTSEISAVPDGEPVEVSFQVMNTQGATSPVDGPAGIGLLDETGAGIMFLGQKKYDVKKLIMDVCVTTDFGATKTQVARLEGGPGLWAAPASFYDFKFEWDRDNNTIDCYAKDPNNFDSEYLGRVEYIEESPTIFEETFQDGDINNNPEWTQMLLGGTATIVEHPSIAGNYVFDADVHGAKFKTYVTSEEEVIELEFEMSSNTGTLGGLCPIGFALTDTEGEGMVFIGAIDRQGTVSKNVVIAGTTTDNLDTYTEIAEANSVLGTYSARNMNSFKFVWNRTTGDISMYAKNYTDGELQLMATTNYVNSGLTDFSKIVLNAIHQATYVDNIRIKTASELPCIDDSLVISQALMYIGHARYNMDELLVTVGEPNAVCGDADHPRPAGDLDGDCEVGLSDLSIVGSDWLESTDAPAATLTVAYLEAEDDEEAEVYKTDWSCYTIRDLGGYYPEEIYYMSNCGWVPLNSFSYYQYRLESGDLPAGKYYIYIRQGTYNHTARLRLKISEDAYWYQSIYKEPFELSTSPALKSPGYNYPNDIDFDMRWVPVTVGYVENASDPYELAVLEVKAGSWYSIMMERYWTSWVGYDTIAFVNARYVDEYVAANGELWWPDYQLGNGEDYTPNITFGDTIPAPTAYYGDASHPVYAGDLNEDGSVDLEDFAVLAETWAESGL